MNDSKSFADSVQVLLLDKKLNSNNLLSSKIREINNNDQ